MPRVVHFQIYVDDPERAGKFYSEIFDWQLNRWQEDADFWLVNTGDEAEPGINGGMVRRHEPAAVTTTLVMQVSSIDDYIPRIVEGGGTLTIPKFAIPGVGYAAYFTDTEGNSIGIFEDDDGAA